jgi:hypothetical protein
MDRYQAEPLRLYDLMSEFLVHCPKCDGRAEIKIPKPFDYKNGELKCTSCHFSQKTTDLIRYKLAGKAKCHECLEFLNIATTVEYKSIPTYVNIRCNSCQTINKVSENWEPYVLRYQDSGIIDPVFGLPLWYQDMIKGNIIWAYNLRHLTEIKHYVQATLRERTTDKFKMTMVERLPDFIKLAKNREEILKVLTQMLEK